MEKIKEVIKNNQNKILIILLVIIILLQVAIRISYGMDKAYLHMDEGYSYGLMNYDKVDIMNNEDFYFSNNRKVRRTFLLYNKLGI